MTKEAKIITAIGIITLVLVIGASAILGKPKNNPNATNAPADPSLLVHQNSHQTTSSGAKVTVVEFGDYQCPACGVAHPIVKQMLKDYSDKVNFVFRNYPLPMHKNALIAAESAEAAAAQGKFWEMHDLLYENQASWSDSSKSLDIYKQYATQLNLDVTKFESDVIGNKYDSIIRADQSDGDKLNVNATPTFFVNGEKLEGVPTYENLKTKLDALLK